MLSDKNVASISATLQNLEKISGGIADRDDGMQALIVSARDAARNLDTTLTTTNGTIKRLDQNLVQQLPGILEKPRCHPGQAGLGRRQRRQHPWREPRGHQ